MPDFAKRLEQLAGRDPQDQKYLLAGILQEELDSPVVVVGGSLVQLYCMGAITSLDLDIVADYRAVQRILGAAGFLEHPTSMWRHPDYAPVVNVVAASPGPHEKVQAAEFEGHRFAVVSPEDCLVDRLCGAVHWQDKLDWERSITLARVLWDELDHKRLRTRAKQENVEDALGELERLVA